MRLNLFTLLPAALMAVSGFGQPADGPAGGSHALQPATAEGRRDLIVRITGARFAYPLVQQWIDRYNKDNPDVQVIIESRGSSDPVGYDILVEGYEHPEAVRKTREYVYIARYAVLPVANSASGFARIYGEKGVHENLIRQIFFHDILADKENDEDIEAPYTIYTRLQKAGTPTVFSRCYGYEQKDLAGKGIAGSDEHLRKAVLRDSTAVSYLPLSLIFDPVTGKAVDGITVLPVDLDGNGKVNAGEKFYEDLNTVIGRLEETSAKDLAHVPLEYLHLSVDRKAATHEAVAFVRWIIHHGGDELHRYGFLLPEPGRPGGETFEQFVRGFNR